MKLEKEQEQEKEKERERVLHLRIESARTCKQTEW